MEFDLFSLKNRNFCNFPLLIAFLFLMIFSHEVFSAKITLSNPVSVNEGTDATVTVTFEEETVDQFDTYTFCTVTVTVSNSGTATQSDDYSVAGPLIFSFTAVKAGLKRST